MSPPPPSARSSHHHQLEPHLNGVIPDQVPAAKPAGKPDAGDGRHRPDAGPTEPAAHGGQEAEGGEEYHFFWIIFTKFGNKIESFLGGFHNLVLSGSSCLFLSLLRAAVA